MRRRVFPTQSPIGGVPIAPICGGAFPFYPAATLGATGDQITANFGNSAFVGAVPSRFTVGATPTLYAIPTQIGTEAWAVCLPVVQFTQIGVEAFGQNGGAAQLTQVASEVFGSVSGVTRRKRR